MSEPDKLGGDFEFSAGIKVENGYLTADGTLVLYTVTLPHQCDSWVITETLSREDAVTEMEAFIREAQAALEKLREAT